MNVIEILNNIAGHFSQVVIEEGNTFATEGELSENFMSIELHYYSNNNSIFII